MAIVAACVQRGTMRGGVDAERHSADDVPARASEPASSRVIRSP
jgi:hypothetical protein